MAKSRGRKFAELVAPTNGIFDAASLPTIPAGKLPTISLSKLANSTFSVNSESAQLGGNITLDTGDITEHTSNKYFTDTRADARITAHNLLARAGGTMTGNLTLGDNVNAYFGASTDLRIYHDGTNSHIINSTGELRFSGSDFAIKSDSAKLLLGAGDDLQIYHEGQNSYIRDTGTGALRIAGSEVSLLNAAHSEFMLRGLENGAVTLYYDSVAKLATTSGGVTVTGGLTATALAVNSGGSTSDLSGTAIFRIMGGDVRITNAAGSEAMATFAADGAVTLFHDASAKLATTSTGVQTTGTLNVNGAYSFPTSDGTNGQVLQTDGSGNLTFVTGGGAGDITAVVAGTNLTGGATSGSATVNLAGSLTSMSKITFTNSNVQAPTTSDATTGARLVLYSNGSGRDYSIGIEADTMWFNSDDDYKWYSDGSLKFNWNNTAGQLEIGGNKVWHAGNDGTGSGLDADTVDGIQAASFLRSDTNDSVGTDVSHDYGPNSTWSSTLRVGGNGYSAGQNNAIASVVTTNGNLHLDAGGNKAIYLNHYSGTAGISFGGGSSGSVAWMGPDGDLWKGTGGDNTGDKYWHAGNDGASSGLFSQYTNTLVGAGGINNAVSSNDLEYSGQISASVSGLFSASNNANGILRLNTHTGNYYHDLGFSSDGNMYHRRFNNANNFTTAAWYKVWTANNDGSGSGLDADTLDGLDSPDFARRGSSYATYFDGTATSGNLARFYCNGNIATSTAYQTRLEVYSGAGVGTDAFMTFHVGSDYAAYFGMDGGINDLAYGGWSKGSNSNRVWHAANDGSGSGLDADTLDGQHASAFQAAGTYLTSSNDRIFITDTRGANRLPSYYDDRYMQADFTQSTYLGISSGADTWTGVLTVSPWTVYHSGHRQQQLIFAGTNLYRRTASGDNAWGSTYKLWDSGNDGSGSGLDADTVDSIHGTSLLRSDADDTFGSTSANQTIRFNCNSGQYIASAGTTTRFPIEIYGPTTNGGDAGITFHVSGDYAGFFGLDSALNDLAWGGWSVGSTTKHRIWHQGNDGSGSGLDADLLDGLQGSSYMGYLGMATNRDDYVNLRVVRNSGSSAGSNGMYIGYGNAGSGVTRLYGGGSTSNHIAVSSSAISFTNIALNSTSLNNGQTINIKGALTGPTSTQNTQNGGNYHFGYQYLGAWSTPYPDLVLGYHTGMRIGGYYGYGGTRIYSDHPHRTTTILFSVGNGDTHVRATNNIYAYTSDKRLKENFRPIENAVDKVKSINGLIFDWKKDMMEKHDFTPDQEKDDAGLIAQEVQKIMPAAIRRAPFDHDLTAPNQSKSGEEFLTVQYEKMVPLLVEAIKEQQKQIDELKKLLEEKE